MPLAALRHYARRFIRADPLPADVPPRCGRYELSHPLGQGSMGTVYKALDPTTRDSVALKVLRRDRLHEDLLRRLRTEAEAGRRLRHPNVVTVLEFCDDGDCAYLVMEHVSGCSLRNRLARPLGIAQTMAIMQQLLEALEHAHRCGVWHRDVKPSNILLSHAGVVKLADFGIAAIRASTLPQSDAVMGTAGFIPPESYLTDTVDGRADVFAAGVVLYRMLTGALPFDGSPDQIMFKVCCESPPAPSVAACAGHLQSLDAVVLKALARRPEDRFATPADFSDALRPFADLRRRRLS